MADLDEVSWMESNIQMVENYLKKEFENFSIVHRADSLRTHTFTVDSGKKRFRLCIGWPLFVDRSFTPARIHRLLKENVAEEMRLHGDDGYHWTPPHEDATPRGPM